MRTIMILVKVFQCYIQDHTGGGIGGGMFTFYDTR